MIRLIYEVVFEVETAPRSAKQTVFSAMSAITDNLTDNESLVSVALKAEDLIEENVTLQERVT